MPEFQEYQDRSRGARRTRRNKENGWLFGELPDELCHRLETLSNSLSADYNRRKKDMFVSTDIQAMKIDYTKRLKEGAGNLFSAAFKKSQELKADNELLGNRLSEAGKPETQERILQRDIARTYLAGRTKSQSQKMSADYAETGVLPKELPQDAEGLALFLAHLRGQGLHGEADAVNTADESIHFTSQPWRNTDFTCRVEDDKYFLDMLYNAFDKAGQITTEVRPDHCKMITAEDLFPGPNPPGNQIIGPKPGDRPIKG